MSKPPHRSLPRSVLPACVRLLRGGRVSPHPAGPLAPVVGGGWWEGEREEKKKKKKKKREREREVKSEWIDAVIDAKWKL